MTVLTVRRHAQSIANAAGRIQGRLAQADLTPAGHHEADAWARGLTVGSIDTLWSSEAVRAQSTARAAASRLGLPVRIEPTLAEVGAGILEGLTHEQARIRYPDAHRVWVARGDLDAIPGAEPGDRVQARAVAFLALVGRLGNRHLAVTHGAFLRCLVNTATARARDDPVAVGHADRHVLTEPWSRLAPAAIGHSWRPPVYAVDTGPGGKYVVKWIRADDLDRYLRVQSAIGAGVLATTQSPDGNIVVRRHLPGTTVPHRITAAQEWELLTFYRDINSRIDGSLTPALRTSLPTLADRIRAAAGAPDTEGSATLHALSHDSRVSRLLSKATAATDFDLHRDNTLRAGRRLAKIDFDGLCSGPAAWPEACALVGASALYPPMGTGPRPHHTITGELAVLVRIRLLLGLGHFQTAARTGAPVERYVRLYRDALATMV